MFANISKNVPYIGIKEYYINKDRDVCIPIFWVLKDHTQCHQKQSLHLFEDLRLVMKGLDMLEDTPSLLVPPLSIVNM